MNDDDDKAPVAVDWTGLVATAMSHPGAGAMRGKDVPAWSATPRQRDWVRKIVTELKDVHPAIQEPVLEMLTREDLSHRDIDVLIKTFWSDDMDGEVYPHLRKRK